MNGGMEGNCKHPANLEPQGQGVGLEEWRPHPPGTLRGQERQKRELESCSCLSLWAALLLRVEAQRSRLEAFLRRARGALPFLCSGSISKSLWPTQGWGLTLPSGGRKSFAGTSTPKRPASLRRRRTSALSRRRRQRPPFSVRGFIPLFGPVPRKPTTTKGVLWLPHPGRPARAWSSTGLQAEPNITIMAALLALLQQIPNWVVAGDWNVDLDKFAGTNIAASASGEILGSRDAAIDSGNTLDFVMASRTVAGLIRLRVDKVVPFAPHFCLMLEIDLAQGLLNLPTLKGFAGLQVSPRPLADSCRCPRPRPCA